MKLYAEQSRWADANDVIAGLERRISDLESEARSLRDDLESMYLRYPPLPEVQRFPHGGHVWFTDGWRAVRDGWPVQFADADRGDLTKSGGALVDQWQAVNAPATAEEIGECYDGEVVILSTGATLNRDSFDELTPGPGWTLHNEGETKAAVWKNEAGEVVAAQMPRQVVNIKNRRPYARPVA